MNLRDKRQIEFADKWIMEGEKGILNLFPRFGKIRTSVHIFNKTNPVSILISYPDNKIKKSWKDEFKILNFDHPDITFTNHRSLSKYMEDNFDLIVIDEVHLLSDAQILVLEEIMVANKKVLGLTGTLSSWTEKNLKRSLDLKVVAKYDIATAIKEGVVADYEIIVIKVPMDNTVKQSYKNKIMTEKQRLRTFNYVINKLEEDQKDSFFMKLKVMEIFQNSLSKKRKIMELISQHKKDRVLVFCGRKDFIESLGIPYHHSTSKNENEFNDFAEGKGNHMAVINIGNTGVTYKPLNYIIINSIDSNSENMTQKISRCLAIENTNPDKKGRIYITVVPDSLEMKWLKSSLENFDKDKIKYIGKDN